MRISTKLGETDLVLHYFTGKEAMSSPFEFRVEMLSEDEELDLKGLLRSPALITVTHGSEAERYIHGQFRSLRQGGRGKDKLTAYEGILVPAFWFLTLGSDCRIFQNMTVPDIVKKIFSEQGITDFKLQLTKDYPEREYCVQYRETHFNFVARLLEEEGIFYFFEHTKTKHTIVLADAKSAIAPCPGRTSVRYSQHTIAWGEESGVEALERVEAVYTEKITLSDYDFEKPRLSLKVSVGEKTEAYDYPGRYLDVSNGDRLSRIRLEEEEVKQLTVSGKGRCRTFTSGYRFKLEEHYRDDNNTDYTLVSVKHEAKDNNYRASDRFSDPFTYSNEFEAIPYKTVFRPGLKTPRPVVDGPQTALVVGKSGEEIWVDKYGRVKVQFYWDREGKKDENSSCWIRVSQSWAGKNWGWVTLPRIGQEVIVEFLEANPDRPLITGRVYNADNMPPYSLPGNQTQSGIKSRSSKQGGTDNFNEIRFEDLKGSEMITVHAEKDMETTVEHDDTQKIQNNRTITVDGTHTETITKDTTIKITQGNLSLTLNMGNQSTTLEMGNLSTKIDLGKSTTEAMQSIEMKVGGSSIVMNQIGITLKATMITLEANAITQVKGNALLILKGGLTMIN
jgi:type VI secretion system secreted protein VgrG